MTSSLLPDYSIRFHHRARSVRIKVTPAGRVEVVLPSYMDASMVPELLHRRREWLNEVLEQIRQNHQALPLTQGLTPERIELKALAESWPVEYLPADQQLSLKQIKNRSIQLCGCLDDAENETETARLLRNWLQQRAKKVLPGWIRQVSEEVGLSFNKVTIRGQKTRWGSCSLQKNINLNRNLLFLEPATVRYLFVHELCHTMHMNHSRQFWRLVEQHVPDFRHHEKVINAATKVLPLWVYA